MYISTSRQDFFPSPSLNRSSSDSRLPETTTMESSDLNKSIYKFPSNPEASTSSPVLTKKLYEASMGADLTPRRRKSACRILDQKIRVLDLTCLSEEECNSVNDSKEPSKSRSVIDAEVRVIDNSACAVYKIRLKVRGTAFSLPPDGWASSGSEFDEQEEVNPPSISKKKRSSKPKLYYIYRRYNDFYQLNQRLGKQLMPDITDCLPTLPTKRFLKMKKFDSAFIESRRVGLDHYLTAILDHPVAGKNVIVKEFLNDSIWMKPQDEIDAIYNVYTIGKFLNKCADVMSESDEAPQNSSHATAECSRSTSCLTRGCGCPKNPPFAIHKRVLELMEEYDYERKYLQKGTLHSFEQKIPCDPWFYQEFSPQSHPEHALTSGVHNVSSLSSSDSSSHPALNAIPSSETIPPIQDGGIHPSIDKPTEPHDASSKGPYDSLVMDVYPSRNVLSMRAQFLRDYHRKRFGHRTMNF
eukprot:Sdes_comp16032_c0_seq1m5222